MTKGLVIDLKRTGFPVKIGEVELWFDNSLENLRRFFNLEEYTRERLAEAQKKAESIHFPEDISVDNLEVATVDAAMDINKEVIAAQYDILFGEGTFERLYKVYPDVIALEDALEIAGVGIGARVEELELERVGKTEAKKAEYLGKKAQKK